MAANRKKGGDKKKAEEIPVSQQDVTPSIPDDSRLPDISLFSVDEVAAYFKTSRSTIYFWIDHGILKAEKYGGTLRISREAILSCRFNNRVDPLA